MFALGIRYLMGRAVAARYEARDEPEWPPHPDRVFMALAAAQGEGEEIPAEADALRWLEDRPAPAIAASREVGYREPVTVFVPVNDDSAPISKNKPLAPMGPMPIGRIRQPRSFPATVPECPDVYLVWPGIDLPPERRPDLEKLCEKVTYLGHSTSPVQMWIEDFPPRPSWWPDDAGRIRLRVPGNGRFDELRRRYNAKLRPIPAAWKGYRLEGEAVQPEPTLTPFSGELVILRQVAGPLGRVRRFGLETGYRLGQALRNTLMSNAGLTPPPAWLSGHAEDGQPFHGEHLAAFPLGFVGREHADGHLMGMALAVPRSVGPEQVAELYRWMEAEPGFIRVVLTLGALGECCLELDTRDEMERPFTLRPSTYLGGDDGAACCWATVTPIVLDQFPRRSLTAGEVIANSCTRAGLPCPMEVETGGVSAHEGAPHSRAFPALPARPGRPPRPLTHATLRFPRPVRGPLLIGAGRYLGYGLCRPRPILCKQEDKA